VQKIQGSGLKKQKTTESDFSAARGAKRVFVSDETNSSNLTNCLVVFHCAVDLAILTLILWLAFLYVPQWIESSSVFRANAVAGIRCLAADAGLSFR